jgi:hypothetical protein
MLLFCENNAGRYHKIKTTNKFFEKAAKTKYLKKAPTNENR